jgi:hypothetical protein
MCLFAHRFLFAIAPFLLLSCRSIIEYQEVKWLQKSFNETEGFLSWVQVSIEGTWKHDKVDGNIIIKKLESPYRLIVRPRLSLPPFSKVQLSLDFL